MVTGPYSRLDTKNNTTFFMIKSMILTSLQPKCSARILVYEKYNIQDGRVTITKLRKYASNVWVLNVKKI
jgi:hypothetical protein